MIGFVLAVALTASYGVSSNCDLELGTGLPERAEVLVVMAGVILVGMAARSFIMATHAFGVIIVSVTLALAVAYVLTGEVCANAMPVAGGAP